VKNYLARAMARYLSFVGCYLALSLSDTGTSEQVVETCVGFFPLPFGVGFFPSLWEG